ncbi:DUF3995 domain-containing protein [Chromobacterium phragmitis]|uniref:DUF3995 domain-containing protein n=1 Tax=Chromobacterium phragmitis TaxID=2202141 RepID=A0A344UEX9_9NEIS|nr:DUF3995 domain-containing protein [Chromobacterium phragmitis]AXE28500.1 DUF3995 domain-containing protein [Chromobacterium phragmitis]AXE33827.1 DUF3995 domain-containing protein [Chromobacterium phragmitis]
MLSLALCLAFALISAMHFYWAFGGRAGLSAAIPEVDGRKLFQPSAAGTAIIAVMLAAAAAAIALHGGRFFPEIGWLARVLKWGLLALGAGMLLRGIGEFRYVGLFKRVKGSRFARNDTRFYSPLCLMLAAGLFYLAW